jgi:hypothetical protein
MKRNPNLTPAQRNVLDLASRKDGYLAIAGDPAISELLKGRRITVKYFGDGCVIAKAVYVPTIDKTPRTGRDPRWKLAAERGAISI